MKKSQTVKMLSGILLACLFVGWSLFLTLYGTEELNKTIILRTVLPVLISSGVILLLFSIIRKKKAAKGDDVVDERMQFIRDKAARIAYSVYYLAGLLGANVSFFLWKQNEDERFFFVSLTLFASIIVISLINIIAYYILKRNYS